MERIWKQAATDKMALGTFLSQSMHFTKKQISQAKFRKDGICVNGIQRRITYELQRGDIVEVKLEEADVCSRHFISGVDPSFVSGSLDHVTDAPAPGVFVDPDILWEDEDLLAVNKPAGLVVHPSHGHYQDTLANLVFTYAKKKGENLRIRAVGRLDKETSGIVLFAKNQIAAARLAKQREKGILTKTYLALASGKVEPDSGAIDFPIRKQPDSLMKMQTTPGEGKTALTRYQVLGYGDDCTLVRVNIQTGRTHQIRVHFAALGHPLLGDRLYGGPEKHIARTALHAGYVDFIHPIKGQRILLEAPAPEDFRSVYNRKICLPEQSMQDKSFISAFIL